VKDLSIIESHMKRLRAEPPHELAGQAVSFTDFEAGWGEYPGTDAVQFDLADGRRVIVRPSGTEPKLKCYLQAIGETRVNSQELLAELRDAMEKVLG
jgi:phosphomannomutase